MRKRLLYSAGVTAFLAATTFAALTLPASAELRTISVTLADGSVVQVQVDVPPDTPLKDIHIGVPGAGEPAPAPGAGQPAPAPGQTPGAAGPLTRPAKPGERPASRRGKRQRREAGDEDDAAPGELLPQAKRRRKRRATDLRNADGSPTQQNPGFFDALPGPTRITGVPNFVIRKFRVPIFLLPIYQAAGVQYGIRWEHLAAINEIETDYGRNLNVSSAGALGWMQFIPSSWRAYGVDANKDGKKDPYNPVDAIFAAARYLKAAGYEEDVNRALFAYNHANWYVDSVNLRAKLIAGIPGDLVGSLTGLTEGRFPVAARARYADDITEKEAEKRFRRGQNAARVIESDPGRRDIEIYARKGAPVVAVNDGVVKKMGENERLGRYVTLQDVYGNRYTYAGLGRISESYPVPKDDGQPDKSEAEALRANETTRDEPAPDSPASAGVQQLGKAAERPSDAVENTVRDAPPEVPVKERLFANPAREAAKEAGGAEQILNSEAGSKGYTTFRNYFSRAFGLNARDVELKRMRRGARLIGGTIIGRVGRPDSTKASHLSFSITPAGRGSPSIDPKPILDGWKLLEHAAVYRANGRNALHGDDEDEFSIGQILLLPKSLLERRVLSDPRIEIYDCGRDDIRSGQINWRVLATLEYLAEVGLKPTVTSLKCGHGYYTKSGNVSHHSSGNAVDIAKINGVPVLGHQEKGGVTEQAVTALLKLQGTVAPDQIISLLKMGGPTFAMSDHADHIHVGFRPLFGANTKLGRQRLSVLKPGQWHNLLEQLGTIDDPVVPLEASKYALPVKKRSSDAHAGE